MESKRVRAINIGAISESPSKTCDTSKRACVALLATKDKGKAGSKQPCRDVAVLWWCCLGTLRIVSVSG
eukprot:3252325-Amphidinium_carterae.1